MSDLTDAIDGLNQAAVNANNTTTFFDDVTTLGDTATVTNPNNKLTVPSVQKQVKDLVDGLVDIPPLDSVAEIPSITGYSIGDKVQWLGYYSASDGGSNWGIIKEGAHTEDGGSVFTIDGDFYVEANLSGASYNPSKFGVIESLGDNYDRMQAFADYVSARSILDNETKSVEMPQGDFFLSDQVVFDVQRGPGTRGVTFKGQGSHSTRFVATEDNSSGLLKFTSTGNIELWHVSGVGFTSSLVYTDPRNNGTALLIESTLDSETAGFGSQANRTVLVEDVFVGPQGYSIPDVNSGEIGNFYKGLEIRNKWFPMVKGSYFRGSYDQLLTEATGRYAGVYCYNCYSPEFIEIQVTAFWEHGIYCEQVDDEDFRMQDSFLVGQYKGFTYTHPESKSDGLYEPGGAISNCHMNSHHAGVHLRYHRQVNISGCYFYPSRGNRLNQGEAGTPSAVWLEGCSDVMVNNNQFLETGFYVDDDNTSVGVKVEYAAKGVVILNNHFNHGGVGVLIKSDVDDVVQITGSNHGGQAVWSTDFYEVVDKSGVALVLDEVITDPTSKWIQKESRNGVTIVNGAPYREQYVSKPSDYSSRSDAQIIDRKTFGTMSDGTEAGINHSYAWESNDPSSPELSIKTYFQTSSGVTQMYGFKTPTTELDSSLSIAFLDNGIFKLRTVTVGEAGSGGTGKRMLTVSN